MTTNPLLTNYTVPPLTAINPEHFVPAIEQHITEARSALTEITNNPAAPTFENTVLPLEKLFHRTTDVAFIMYLFYSSIITPEIREAYPVASEALTNFHKEVFQNPELAKRFKHATAPADEESTWLYTQLELEFARTGAFLKPEQQTRFKQIDTELISLCNTFEESLVLGASPTTLHLHITDENELEGVPEAYTEMFKATATEAKQTGWIITPERLLIDSLLEVAANQNLRARLLEMMDKLGTIEPHNNQSLIRQVHRLRQERAQLLGYPDYTTFALATNMAGNVPAVRALLEPVAEQALVKFADTYAKVSQYAQSKGFTEALSPSDLSYWVRRYREEFYHFDETELSNYLPLEAVRTGFFNTVETLFDVTFKPNTSHPNYHQDVTVYDVIDQTTNTAFGILYMDLFSREGKRDGAWMAEVQAQQPGKPVIVTLNMNLPKPTAGKAVLLTYEQASTFFHEGGHAMHGLLGTNGKYRSGNGTAGPSDFVELQSTILEHWMSEPEILRTFARHHETGAEPPEQLLQAMSTAMKFYAEWQILRVTQNALRDLHFHQTPASSYTDTWHIQQQADFNHPLTKHIRSYPLTRFGHLFSDPLSGYAAGYYGYLWAQQLSAAAYDHFRTNGPTHKPTANRLKAMYSEGSRRNPNAIFEAFNGAPAGLEPLLRETGILTENK